jgi:sulfotransferase family protein
VLIVSNSLPKCASTWAFFCIDHALRDLGFAPASAVASARLNAWGNPGELTRDVLSALTPESARHEYYAIKSHEPPGTALLSCIDDGRCRVSYIIRHPLDIVASTLDYGIRLREIGDASQPYYHIHTVDDALGFLIPFWDRAIAWRELAGGGKVLIVRYEDLTTVPLAALCKMFEFYAVPRDRTSVESALQKAIDAHSIQSIRDGAAPWSMDHLRVNVGEAGRYTRYFPADALETLRARLATVIDRLGYE